MWHYEETRFLKSSPPALEQLFHFFTFSSRPPQLGGPCTSDQARFQCSTRTHASERVYKLASTLKLTTNSSLYTFSDHIEGEHVSVSLSPARRLRSDGIVTEWGSAGGTMIVEVRYANICKYLDYDFKQN